MDLGFRQREQIVIEDHGKNTEQTTFNITATLRSGRPLTLRRPLKHQ